jgi:hypothetical protein
MAKKPRDTSNDYRARIYFQDEVVALGCGWRTVTVREGRKWAYLTDAMGRRARITLDLLDQLKPNEA